MGTSAARGRTDSGCEKDGFGQLKDSLRCAQANIRNYFYALGLRGELGLVFSLPAAPEVMLSPWGRSAVCSPLDRGEVGSGPSSPSSRWG